MNVAPALCPVCGAAPGNDHRRCYFQGLQDGLWKSSGDWMDACRAYAAAARPPTSPSPAPSPAVPTPPPAPAPAAVEVAAAPATGRKCGICRQPGHTRKTCTASAGAPTPSPAVPPKPAEPAEWTRSAASLHTFPAGRYYIGDICYPIGDSPLYDGVWGRHGYDPGVYTDGAFTFAVSRTAYGDGSYKGTDGYEYSVDAGCIGIVPTTLFDEAEFHKGYRDCTKPGGCGRILEVAEPITFSWDGDSTFTFRWGYNEERIRTDGWGEDEEDEDY